MKSGSAPSSDGDYGVCPVHDVDYFKTRMGVAHKLDGGGWCNKPLNAPSSPAEPISEPQDTEHLRAATLVSDAEYGEPESDGGPALFPPEQASASPEAKPKIKTMKALLAAIHKDFGLGKADLPEIERMLKRAGMKPLAEVTNFDATYAAIDTDVQKDRDEAAYRAQQEQPVANTE